MGKYLPVIKTAECGSLTKAAHVLGYTQPSLGYIINNIEDELGVKLFYRDQRGVTLTENGQGLLEIMKQIETMEDRLRETARVSQGTLIRVGIFPSPANQWMPSALQKFYDKHPEVRVKLVHQMSYLDGELGVREHSLDCSFFTGKSPRGLESVPLYEDPYYLVVSTRSSLADLDQVSVWDLVDKERFIPTNESCDAESAIWNVYQAFAPSQMVDARPQENQMTLSMVDQNLGVTILPEMDLMGRLPSQTLVAIPLKEKLTRTVSLLCPRSPERPPLTADFLHILQTTVEEWKQAGVNRVEQWKKK